jgi:hypothetical protein
VLNRGRSGPDYSLVCRLLGDGMHTVPLTRYPRKVLVGYSKFHSFHHSVATPSS